MSVKQVIVVRTRYPDGKGGFFKPRTGKLIAQGAHASMKVFFDRADVGFAWRVGRDSREFNTRDEPGNPGEPAMLTSLTEDMAAWAAGSFAKVCVRATSEEQLLELHAQAKKAGLPCAIIQDSGKTEFDGVATYTALAIGPALREDIDPITGDLKLL